jgi:hypothetical protein
MMNNNEASIDFANNLDTVEDPSGLAEIQKALEEIEKLKNEESPQEENLLEEESVAPEENESAETAPSEAKPLKLDKIWKIKRSRYKALAEKRAALEENARLKEMLAESLNSGTYHYGKTTYSELERAKENKKRAIENGDIDALIEADIALNKAAINVNELEKWTSSETKKSSQEKIREQPYEDHNEIEQAMATDWLDNHSYLQPNSRDYSPTLANEVAQFINYLDENLANNGQKDIYFSEQYFNTIDQYIGEAKDRIRLESKNNSSKSPKNLESAGHVGGVRNSYSSSPINSTPTSTQLILTADEKRMCANAGITEKDWLRYKLEDLKKGK